MSPIFWLVGLVIVFIIYDEGTRLRRRVKALEERLDRIEGVTHEPGSDRPAGGRPFGRPGRDRDDRGEGGFPS